jgi:predicted dehydrogenase
MVIRVAMIGYGAVGSIHAAKLANEPGVRLVSVFGPSREKASSFASANGIPRACDGIEEALSGADVAIVCSPSPAHFEQARECLERGVHTLVELPPCEDAVQARTLAEVAERRAVTLGCAHTSRFVSPYARIRKSIDAGLLGEIREIHYIRCHRLHERSWSDNALLHHAAHPLDLLFYWCGGVESLGCVALPDERSPQTVSVLGRLPSGGPATVTVTYSSHLPQTRMLVVGKHHTVEINGFSNAKSDFVELEFNGNEQDLYEEAIRLQDIAFLHASQDGVSFVAWDETVRVLRAIDRCRVLAASAREDQQSGVR